MDAQPIARALLSVSDKEGLADFARALAERGVELYSTGGTRKHLEGAGLKVVDIAAYTGFPEMLDGRLKTLHPKIFGGLLGRRDRADDMTALAEHGILLFDLVAVNLYPFEATIAKTGVTREEAVEQIDIGGPSLVRAAAKNHAFTAIATSPRQYALILAEFREHGGTTLALRKRLMAEAFAHTAAYDRVIADYFARGEHEPSAGVGPFRTQLDLSFQLIEELRYGENPHQRGALYGAATNSAGSLVTARKLNGKELSYNNLLDLDSALAIVRSLAEPAAVVIKHNNPCGAAAAGSLAEAAAKALAGDPLSAFGGVLGFNRLVDTATAEVLAAPGLFIEAIVAPDFEPAALEILTTRPKWKSNVRLLAAGPIDAPPSEPSYRQIAGGLLAQDADTAADPENEWKVAAGAAPSEALMDELRFGWAVVRHVKSNAITVSKDRALLGAGAGQMSRVDSVEIALTKAGERARGAVLASDAFFPFPDSIHKAAAAGVVAIIQPGGSKKDDEVIAACNEHGLAMIFTGRRHFKH
jgi:phosphoribosylaminoimidazolecarboxamide formyltransferase/IMP cyclohydrolase